MTISGVALVIVPFASPKDSVYQFMALGLVLLGVPVYFVAIRGFCKPKILTKLNGKLMYCSQQVNHIFLSCVNAFTNYTVEHTVALLLN